MWVISQGSKSNTVLPWWEERGEGGRGSPEWWESPSFPPAVCIHDALELQMVNQIENNQAMWGQGTTF